MAEWQTQRIQKPSVEESDCPALSDSDALAISATQSDPVEPITQPRFAAASDPIEVALADALTKASSTGQWDVVGQLARELEARRVARVEKVVPLRPKHIRGA